MNFCQAHMARSYSVFMQKLSNESKAKKCMRSKNICTLEYSSYLSEKSLEKMKRSRCIDGQWIFFTG
jgi:hypothetical protein